MHQRLATFISRYGLSTRGVIHVGAHTAQERPYYVAAGFKRELWIEPQPLVFARLLAALPPGTANGVDVGDSVEGEPLVRAVNVACGEVEGEAFMHVLNDQESSVKGECGGGGGGGGDGLSNSLLEPTGITGYFPGLTRGESQRVRVTRLDDLIEQIDGFKSRKGDRPGVPYGESDGGSYSLMCLDTQGYELHVLRGADRTLRGLEAVLAEVFTAEYYRGAPLVGQVDDFMGRRGFVKAQCRISRRRRFGDALYVRLDKVPAWRAALSKLGVVGLW